MGDIRMSRISNEVIVERINNLQLKVDAIHKKMDTDVKCIKNEVKHNTEFRNKASGAISTLVFAAGLMGGGIAWILSKIFK